MGAGITFTLSYKAHRDSSKGVGIASEELVQVRTFHLRKILSLEYHSF